MSHEIAFLDSITDADASSAGKVIVCGSHGGLYPAVVASRSKVHAVILNDAGIGLELAGIAGVLELAKTGTAAAAVDCHSCHIGSSEHMWQQGVLSEVNALAVECGLTKGMPVEEAANLLCNSPVPLETLDPIAESRSQLAIASGRVRVELLDSASMVGPEHINTIVITGSHGALIGGHPERALKATAHIAVFNDAGRGCSDIGVSRLPALQSRNIAAVTVSCNTARIGDAKSALNTGVISECNALAKDLGATISLPLLHWLESLGSTGV